MTDAERAAARERFWATQPPHLWTVPMARDNAVMPLLRGRECGMLEAIARAHAHGKTPLLVDNTEHRVVDTFYMCTRTLLPAPRSPPTTRHRHSLTARHIRSVRRPQHPGPGGEGDPFGRCAPRRQPYTADGAHAKAYRQRNVIATA